MNKTDTPTRKKVMLPLRLPYELYKQMMEEVQSRKDEERGYSVNQYLTELLLEDLEKKTKS